MPDRYLMIPIQRTSLIVYEADIFNCSQQRQSRLHPHPCSRCW